MEGLSDVKEPKWIFSGKRSGHYHQRHRRGWKAGKKESRSGRLSTTRFDGPQENDRKWCVYLRRLPKKETETPIGQRWMRLSGSQQEQRDTNLLPIASGWMDGRWISRHFNWIWWRAILSRISFDNFRKTAAAQQDKWLPAAWPISSTWCLEELKRISKHFPLVIRRNEWLIVAYCSRQCKNSGESTGPARKTNVLFFNGHRRYLASRTTTTNKVEDNALSHIIVGGE